jgi:hypothetical protein
MRVLGAYNKLKDKVLAHNKVKNYQEDCPP